MELELREYIEEIGERIVQEIMNQLIKLDKVASGKLLNSLTYKVVKTIDHLVSYNQLMDLSMNLQKLLTRPVIERWTGEYDQSRLDMFVPRRSRTWLPATTATPAVHDSLINYTTYHSIYGTVSGYISGSSGGVIDIHLNRYDTGETVLSTTQSGNGTYSFIWFDDTEDLFVYAYESETRKGASKVGTMSSGFDINLSSSGGSNEFSYTWYG